jgi:glycerate kinase
MRVLVATHTLGALSSSQAGAIVAAAWEDADVTVVPVGEAGAGFLAAYADQRQLTAWLVVGQDDIISLARSDSTPESGLEVAVAVELAEPLTSDDGPPAADAYDVSSAPLGHAVAAALEEGPVRRLVVDLAGVGAHDGGAGLLAVLGAAGDVALDAGVTPLGGLSSLDLSVVRGRLAGIELVGVVASADLTLPLLGLRGITARRGHAAGDDPARLLQVDAALENLARLVSPECAGRPGAGAAGGLGFAVTALGGRLTTGPELAFGYGILPTPCDLVVTGCDVFDFAHRGGGVVAAAAQRAEEFLCPCIAIAGEVLIGARELRALGIEAAYPVHEPVLGALPEPVTEPALAAAAARVARSWRW